MSTEDTQELHEVFPCVNDTVLTRISGAEGVIYGIGSLYTSLCPCLILGGIGEAIANRQCEKVLMLNGTHDRETTGMDASDVVMAICNALNRVHCQSRGPGSLSNPPSAYVTTLLVPEGGEISVDYARLQMLGIQRVIQVSARTDMDGNVSYMPEEVASTLRQVVEGEEGGEQLRVPGAEEAAASAIESVQEPDGEAVEGMHDEENGFVAAKQRMRF
jgi:cathepsin L